jgi:hypothetical protein
MKPKNKKDRKSHSNDQKPNFTLAQEFEFYCAMKQKSRKKHGQSLEEELSVEIAKRGFRK